MQTTAILGWGSLLWNPKILNYVKEVGWLEDGPVLPIEFSRISNDGRLTLVITENGTYVKTYFAMSNYLWTNEAIDNLVEREGSENIGFYIKETNTFFSCSTSENHCRAYKITTARIAPAWIKTLKKLEKPL